MFAPELYGLFYNQGMLVVSFLILLIYSQESKDSGRNLAEGFNRFMLWILAGGFTIFLGTRPISGIFVDMPTYAASFNIAQSTGRQIFEEDWAFSLLTKFCAEIGDETFYFFVCTLLYVAPIALAAQIINSRWGFAIFFAFASGFSFYAYGVNGIRNGIATSILIAAFSLTDRKVAMSVLMLIALGMHKSVLIPIVAFLISSAYASPGVYAGIWAGALGLATLFGQRLSLLLVDFLPSSDDARISNYALNSGFGADKGGYRLDFILYSILPVFVSYILANPSIKRDSFYRKLLCTYLLANSFWLLAMYAAFSNRFAYLSWFIMPLVIIYPFIPNNKKVSGRIGPLQNFSTMTLSIALFAHFAFTYIMGVFVYPNRT
jgi:hypothetical protein